MPLQDWGLSPSPEPTQYPVYSAPSLTFPGVSEVGPVSSTPLSYGGKFGSTATSSYSTNPGLFTQIFGAVTGGSSTPAARGPAGGPVPTPQVSVNTAQVDGSSGFVNSLPQMLSGVLGSIGSTGDAPAGAMPVAYRPQEQPEGLLSPTTILIVLGVAGVVYALSTTK